MSYSDQIPFLIRSINSKLDRFISLNDLQEQIISVQKYNIKVLELEIAQAKGISRRFIDLSGWHTVNEKPVIPHGEISVELILEGTEIFGTSIIRRVGWYIKSVPNYPSPYSWCNFYTMPCSISQESITRWKYIFPEKSIS